MRQSIQSQSNFGCSSAPMNTEGEPWGVGRPSHLLVSLSVCTRRDQHVRGTVAVAVAGLSVRLAKVNTILASCHVHA